MANVDPRTDASVKTIHANFASNTVLIIAHRLHNIMDLDEVMALSDPAGAAEALRHSDIASVEMEGEVYTAVRATGSDALAAILQ
ncbi:multidrug resistance associated protein 4 [Echinococcus multilocularis]|uniref:Multidrug resistance associated protein 4 n=1 Tax=Echinococcus multilocularis TaxID=6211 RepID=A0A087W243_ECHMU|nr:multidrug resistance associated protein 4 [Echinococcus multilocularis]